MSDVDFTHFFGHALITNPEVINGFQPPHNSKLAALSGGLFNTGANISNCKKQLIS